MTTINSLQNSLQDNPKHLYRHNDQLEELRNLQDKFQEEKTVWLKQKESQEKAMDERQLKQEVMLEQIRRQQDDLEQQREQWFRKMEKMEKLANQQIANVSNYVVGNNVEDSCFNKSTEESATVDVSSLRRKDKRNTSTGMSSQYCLSLLMINEVILMIILFKIIHITCLCIYIIVILPAFKWNNKIGPILLQF